MHSFYLAYWPALAIAEWAIARRGEDTLRRALVVLARADMVLLQARSPEEALRLRAQRLCVVRAGAVVARMAPAVAELALPGRPLAVDFTRGSGTTEGGCRQPPPR